MTGRVLLLSLLLLRRLFRGERLVGLGETVFHVVGERGFRDGRRRGGGRRGRRRLRRGSGRIDGQRNRRDRRRNGRRRRLVVRDRHQVVLHGAESRGTDERRGDEPPARMLLTTEVH